MATAQDIPLSAARHDNRQAQPSLVRRYQLHSDAARLPLSGGDHGLSQPQGSILAAVQHLDADFRMAALEDALARYGKPEIFNTDQGSNEFTNVLNVAGIRISMDGKGRWMDNVMIERLWRPLKYEAFIRMLLKPEARWQGIARWIDLYNKRRPHSKLDGKTPDEVFWGKFRPGYAGRMIQLAA